MQEILRQHLMRAKQIMKDQADKRHSWQEFKVGDQAFLKLQLYIQTSVARRANHKPSFEFFGPLSSDPAHQRSHLRAPTSSKLIHISSVSRVATMPRLASRYKCFVSSSCSYRRRQHTSGDLGSKMASRRAQGA